MKLISPLALITLSILSTTFFSGCAHPYSIEPLDQKPEYLNGVALLSETTPTCVYQAGYQYSNPYEMLVKVRILNKGKSAYEIDPTLFVMKGPVETLKKSPLAAADPEKYIRDLKASADLQESRTKMESYQGLDELGALKGEKEDSEIEAAREIYKKKVNEAEKSKKNAEALRARIAIIEPAVLKKTTAKPGDLIEGALIFPADFNLNLSGNFGETGVVTIESTNSECPAKLSFMLKR